jgi:hypothetical protein
MSCCSNVNVTPIVIGGGNGSTAYDAFGRLRTSTPYTLFDSKNTSLAIIRPKIKPVKVIP